MRTTRVVVVVVVVVIYLSAMENEYTTAQVKEALLENQNLQIEIRKELRLLSERRKSNRAQAQTCIKELHAIAAESYSGADVLQCEGFSRKRKWSRRFFVDAIGDEPEPNSENARQDKHDSFFHHINPPWNKAETRKLELEMNGKKSAEDDVLSEVRRPATTNISQTVEQGSNTSVAARTREECLLHECHLRSTKSLSKPHSDVTNPKDEYEIARLEYEMFVRQSRKESNQSWTLPQDKLLLSFMAAAGPQLVLDSRNPLVQNVLLTQLLPSKSKKQLFNRANQSLLNPNLVRSDWTMEEERRLPIYMKIYKDQDFAVFLASTHFARGTKSVVDKWQRSLNPAYSTRPFSSAEDKRLLRAMRQQQMGWTDLSRKHFPTRHPQRLMSRWSELASDKDIIDRELAVVGAAASL